ncbi:hypothetical protein ACRYCC_34155 [Actinomadura scrupuli]|uniref:hypothetical protein n=1 Tax=Actinomadura scrupuli TaxID=559629 RepID=UPI003D97CEF5
MAGPKVDEHAVLAELDAIRSAMAAVTTAMSPQTWQGGAAGRFTDDLRAANKTLSVMMAEVCQDVAAVNRKPCGPPPAMPRVQPQPATGPVASVSPDGLTRLEYALRAAAGRLPVVGRRIAGLLAAGGGRANTRACDRAAEWCGRQAVTTRQRIEYALASDKVDPLLAGIAFNRMVGIPDVDRFGAGEMRQLGRLQARLFTSAYSRPGSDLQQTLAGVGARLRDHLNDPDYLKAFFGGIPPGAAGRLAYLLHRHSGGPSPDSTDKRILGDMGTALAALSRIEALERTSRPAGAEDDRPIIEHALGAYVADLPGQGLLVKFGDGRWDSHVLAELGQAALRWRLDYHSYALSWGGAGDSDLPADPDGDNKGPNGRHWFDDWDLKEKDVGAIRDLDPAINILAKITQAKDGAAARELASADLPSVLQLVDASKVELKSSRPPAWLSRMPGKTYASLLLAPDWIDGGQAAGGVIRLATMAGRTGTDGQRSALIARELMQQGAWWKQTGQKQVQDFLRNHTVGRPFVNIGDSVHPREMTMRDFDLQYSTKRALLDMSKAYIPSFAAHDPGFPSDAGEPFLDPAAEEWNIMLDVATTRNFLRLIANDDKMRRELIIAAQLFARQELAWAIEHGTIDQVDHAAVWSGRLNANLGNALQAELISQGKTKDEAVKQTKEMLGEARDLVDQFGDKIPVFGELIKVTGVHSVWSRGTDWLLDQIETDALAQAKRKAAAINVAGADQVSMSIAAAIYRATAKGVSVLHSADGEVKVSDIFNVDGTLRGDLTGHTAYLFRQWARQQMVPIRLTITENGHTKTILQHVAGMRFLDKAKEGYGSSGI